MRYRTSIVVGENRRILNEAVNKFLVDIDELFDIGWYRDGDAYCCYLTYIIGGSGTVKKKKKDINVEDQEVIDIDT